MDAAVTRLQESISLWVELGQDKGGDSRGQEAAPSHLARPVGAGLFHGEQDPSYRHPKGSLCICAFCVNALH